MQGDAGGGQLHLSAFVLMPFNDESNVVHDELIAPVLREVGYEVRRADSVIDQRSVLSDIVLGIDAADLIVADLTGLNPNVFYELGIAHGLGIPTVLITQSIEELPFDLRSYRASEYSTRFDEAQNLKKFLQAVGEEAARGEVKFASPVSDFLKNGPAAIRLQSTMDQSKGAGSPRGVSSVQEADTEEDDDGEPGTLDLLHSYIESSEISTGILARIGQETQDVGSKIERHTERMQDAVSSKKPGSVAQVHRVATEVAGDLNAYADALHEELPPLEDSSETMIDSGIGWLNRVGGDQDEGEVIEFRYQLAVLYLVIAEAMASTAQYRNSFASARGATSQLDKASDRVVALLGRLLKVMERTQSFSSRGCDIAQEILGAGPLHVVAEPVLDCFSDSDGTEQQPFSALLVATFDFGVEEGVFPVEGDPPGKHSAVSWDFDEEMAYAETWYRDPRTDQISLGWEESPGFVGREIQSDDGQAS